jgi:di/tricarboxylate transporter
VSFVTPFEPSCILVYGPGKYRFRDFVKVGLLLTLLLMLVILVMVPMLWPLHPLPGHTTGQMPFAPGP